MQGKRKFLLEALEARGSGRYSFLGMDPRKSYSGCDGKLEEDVVSWARNMYTRGDLFVLLKRLMLRITDDIDFPFTGSGRPRWVWRGGSHSTRSRDHTGIPGC